ncbi:hypothetical protein DVR12_12880 [Chitinophaga silvatica]|uniref:Terpene synthase n=1 Tax=Chitinophaga silvatica TaxID=2282649 RepID=A0A3E1YAB5_9BACT|nr:hypothetical protein [Chitinophaga silvatica]RFS22684.1 hypothetical protein DVR12_12880 [Chitinophaga silvatica]
MLVLEKNYVEFPGITEISPYAEAVQAHTLTFAEKFNLLPSVKPLLWYQKAQFGMQGAREYPDAGFNDLCLAGDLLTWLFSVDDKCDRASSNKEEAIAMEVLLYRLIDILENKGTRFKDDVFSTSLIDLLARFNAISTPFLYQLLCKHIVTYLRECFYELDMQTMNYLPSVDEYFKVRPDTGFSIMFPLVAIFQRLNLPDEVYLHPVMQEIELILNLVGGLGNDVHSFHREKNLETTGLNLIFIAQHELKISEDEAFSYVINEHDQYLEKLEIACSQLPFWSPAINTQVDEYVLGLKKILRGYYDWATIESKRYTAA